MAYHKIEPSLIATLRRRIERGLPVQLTLMAFPFKIPNPAKVGSRSLPDLAELAAIQRFCSLERTISTVYPPGLELHILHDGKLLADLFEIPVHRVRRYEAYFQRLLRVAGASRFVHCHDFTDLQHSSGLDPAPALAGFHDEATRWMESTRGTAEWRDCFRKTLGMMNLQAYSWRTASGLLSQARKGHLANAYVNLERRVHRTMVEYRIRDQIIHCFDPRPICFPDAIHATTQQRPGRLALWMVRRGRSLLPWHGVGAVDSRHHVSVVLARQVLERPNFQPIYLNNERSPFFYLESVRRGNTEDPA
jgi:hypothetical protein